MLLNVSNVSKHFAADVVLAGVDLRIERREKVALVGRNGAGKTTLVKILTGEYEPDGGSINWERGASIGYLSQHARLDPERTVLQEAEDARRHLIEMEERMRELEIIIQSGGTADDLEEFSLLQEHFIAGGGYSLEQDLRVVLARMGFDESEHAKPVGKLSGGEKTRLMLAKLLLEEPDLLILDEPTNHLDLEATEWLESWLRAYHGAVLLVSHDRTFLNNVAQRVVEIQAGKAKSYPGPFDHYLRLRAEEQERMVEVAKRQQEEIARLDEYVRRFMNSQRTAQARGRLKQMEKLKAEAIEAPRRDKLMKAGFNSVKRAGDIVFETKLLGMRFGEQRLFHDLDWIVSWGERWGVIGQNGAGKSTLMKVLMGELAPVEGVARVGANVNAGYFTQDAAGLDPELTPLEYLNCELGLELGPARNLLGRFLISGDDSIRPIKTLSGGERIKLQLAVLTALNPNVLVLDEPTNHLDMDSREALAQVIKEYNGTLVLVSHDRWLLGEVTDHTLDLQLGQTRQYPGSYSEYRARRTALAATPIPQTPSPQPKKMAASANSASVSVRFRASAADEQPAMSPRELSKEIGRMERLVAQAEEDVVRLEAQMEELERNMAQPAPDADLLALSRSHAALQEEIHKAFDHWEVSASRLEELKRVRG